VAVGMSGGVDSTVAACLLKQQGYDVLGITMSVWDGGPRDVKNFRGACYGPDEIEELQNVKKLCRQIGIPHLTVDLKKEYRSRVLDYFCGEYLEGKTPNPCVMCNRKLKFGLLVDKAREHIAFDFFATGHYARVFKNEQGRFLLRRAVDLKKDQSYFLWGLSQTQLSTLMLPLGELTKPQVRDIARAHGLGEVAEQAESQDFVDCSEYKALFEGRPVVPGDIVDMQGNKLGTHEGIVYYTVGQRKGIGVGGLKDPLYVVKIDATLNRVVVGPKEELMGTALLAGDLNWIADIGGAKSVKALARIRQQNKENACTAELLDDGTARVVFENPQLSITAGQSIVFYDGDVVLGGGIIKKRL